MNSFAIKTLKYGLVLILFLPLFFTPFTFFPWHYGKTMIFQIVIELLVIIWLVGARHAVPLRVIIKSFNYLDWSIIIFLAIITITSFTGVNPTNSFWGKQARANGVLVWWHFVVYYFLLKNCFRQNENFSRNFIFLSVAVAVLAAISSLVPGILPISWQSTAGGGIIGNRAFLANYLILALGLAIYGITLFKNKMRWLLAFISIVLFYALFLTGNRGAVLGVLAGIFFGLVLLFFVDKTKKIKILSLAAVLCFVSVFSVFFFLNQNGSLAGLPKLSSLLNYSFTSGTGETRLMAWNAAWQGIITKPLGGWGWGNYDVVFDKFYNPNFLKYNFVETVWDKPHNWLLEVGVTGGLAAVVAYLSILVCAVYYLSKNKRIILAATLAGGFVSSLFLFETTNSLLLWFLLLAMAAAIGNQSPPGHDPSGVVELKVRNKICGTLAMLLIFSLLWLNFNSLRYSYFMKRAELSTALMEWVFWSEKALAAPAPFKWENAIFLAQEFVYFDKADSISDNKDVKATATAIASALDVAGDKYPNSLAYPVWAGQVYMILGEKFDKKYYADAGRVLNRAVAISPQKQEVHFLLGRLFLLQQNFSKALAEQRLAVEIAPNIASSHWFYGLTLVASGDSAGGLQEIEKARELGHALSDEQRLYVLDLYAAEKNYPQLISEYNKMIEQEPENLNWYIKLASVYAVAGEKKQALKLAEQILSQAPQLKYEVEKFIQEYKLK